MQPHRFYSSLTIRDVLADPMQRLRDPIFHGVALRFDPRVDRTARLQTVQNHRNQICLEGIRRSNSERKISRFVDQIYTNLAVREMNELSRIAAENPTASAQVQSASSKKLQDKLSAYLSENLTSAEVREFFSKMGNIADVDVVQGKIFRIHFTNSENKSVMMSLSMLLNFLSEGDDVFVSVLDCLNQNLMEQKAYFQIRVGVARNPYTPAQFAALQSKYLEGMAQTRAAFQNRLNVVTVVQQFTEIKLAGADEANKRLKAVSQKSLKAMLGAFLIFQKDEVLDQDEFARIQPHFQERISRNQENAEVEYKYYRSIASLISDYLVFIDLEKIREEQRARDRVLFSN